MTDTNTTDITRKSLREWMDSAGWSVRRLATALHGMHASVLQRYISGERVPDAIVATAIAQRIGVRVEQIIWGRAELQATLLERLDGAGLGMPEPELLSGLDASQAQQELERLLMLDEVAELSHGWVRVE